MDKRNYVVACFIDYRKAFGSISIPLFIKKTKTFCCKDRLYHFLGSFPTKGTQSAVIDTDRSRTYLTLSGFPHDTCLEKLLFSCKWLPLALPTGSFCSSFGDAFERSGVSDWSNTRIWESCRRAPTNWKRVEQPSRRCGYLGGRPPYFHSSLSS